MKKIIAIVTIAAILSLMLATFVFADNSTDVPQWFRDMMSWRKAQVDQAANDGTITKEQAEQYKDQIDKMEKFHTENGFPYQMGPGGFGGCGGGFYNSSANPDSTGYGFGRGMMGRYFTR
jgi:Spy/CpxP family protein refolding chaperone